MGNKTTTTESNRKTTAKPTQEQPAETVLPEVMDSLTIEKSLRVSRSTLNAWRKGGLKHTKKGNKIFYKKTDLFTFLGL